MYYSVLPGGYEFKTELKELLEEFKKQINLVIAKIEEAEKLTGN